MDAISFITKFIVSSGLFYGYYHLFLRNRRFHHYNRFYLLGMAVASFIIPFLHIPVSLLAGNHHPGTFVKTLKVISAGGWEEPVTIYAHRNTWDKWLSLQYGLYLVYIAGLVTGIVLLLKSVAYIQGLKRKYPFEVIDRLAIYKTSEPGTPFSFFQSIFWNDKIPFNNGQGQQIFRHEMFHVKEKHSADLLLIEIFGCLAWFNPFFYLIKKEIRAIHEFLADDYAVSGNNRYDYAELLVMHALSGQGPGITHSFFHNQIKRRINMITQSNLIRHSGYFSRIMALPLLLLLFSAFAVKLTQTAASQTGHFSGKTITVVIDPGHGGRFAGATAGNGLLEKDIDLQIGQKIKALGAAYNVNVVLTRNSDATVGNAADLKKDLLNRVEITQNAKPDAFVSIHVNMSEATSSAGTGFEAYISRRNEDPKSRQLASTVLTSLKDIYAVNEVIRQRDQGIIVIDRKSCPSILLECGYINNPADAAFITNDANQEQIARKILAGIVQYAEAQTNGTTAFNSTDQAHQNNDTLSAEMLSKLNVDDIKSISADMTTNIVTVFFKNGVRKYANAKEVNDYYAAHHLEPALEGYRTTVNMKDSVAEISFEKDTVPSTGHNKIFTKVETEANYPDWPRYLFSHLKYPTAAVKKEVQGTVLIQFIVDEHGKVSDVKAISGPKELQKESIRVVKESGLWEPAKQNGIRVKSYKRQPITYKLA